MWLELGLILLSLLFILHYKKVKELPPGPFSLPIIGTVGLWSNGGGAKGSAVFNAEYWKYKDWYTLFIGTLNYVILNDYKLNKDLFSRDEFSGREKTWWSANIRGINGRNLGIITADGTDWTTQRRFALKQLRDLGFGKKNLDDVMVEEADEVIDTGTGTSTFDEEKAPPFPGLYLIKTRLRSATVPDHREMFCMLAVGNG